MSRPPKDRLVKHRPKIFEFGPISQSASNEEKVKIDLSLDQLEALRLADLEGMSQADAAKMMNVSRQTFGRIVEQAREIIANALINGKSIEIIMDDHVKVLGRHLKCIECGHEWELKDDVSPDELIVGCPECASHEVIKMKRCGVKCECPLRVNSSFGCR